MMYACCAFYLIWVKILDDARFKPHFLEEFKHPLSEVALNQNFSTAGTASHTQRGLESRCHLLEGVFVTHKPRHDGRLLARTPLALKDNVKAGLALLLQGIALGLGLLLSLITIVIVGDRHVKGLAQRVFPVNGVHINKKKNRSIKLFWFSFIKGTKLMKVEHKSKKSFGFVETPPH
jgi:hypothetical protein